MRRERGTVSRCPKSLLATQRVYVHTQIKSIKDGHRLRDGRQHDTGAQSISSHRFPDEIISHAV